MEKYPNDTELHRIIKEQITLKSRDNARTPMQWDTSAYAGFSTAKPWQKENESYLTINAKAQVGIKDSVFEYWASVLQLRKSHKDVFIYGDFKLLDVVNSDVFAYLRTFGEEQVIVVANFRKDTVVWTVPNEILLKEDSVLISNYGGLDAKSSTLSLRPFEAFACTIS